MQALASYTTPKGAKIELFPASDGRIIVHANGKLLGIMSGLANSAAHGKVITLVGQATIVVVGTAGAEVEAAIKASAEQAAEADRLADQRWAEYLQTPEGRIDALMTKINRQESEE